MNSKGKYDLHVLTEAHWENFDDLPCTTGVFLRILHP
jgi:hypothetical protein